MPKSPPQSSRWKENLFQVFAIFAVPILWSLVENEMIVTVARSENCWKTAICQCPSLKKLACFELFDKAENWFPLLCPDLARDFLLLYYYVKERSTLMAVCAVLLWVAIKHCPSSASSVTGFWGGASAGVGARQLPGSASRFGSAATLLILLLPSHSTDSNANGSFNYTNMEIAFC